MGVHNSRWWVGLAAAVYMLLLLPLTGYGLPGDLDGSGRVDGYDLIIMGQAFGTVPSDTGWHPDADLNRDGIVNQGDLEILSAHFGRNGVSFGLWAGSEYGTERLFKLSATGNVLQALAGVTTPVAVAGSIDDNTVWVADAYSDQVMQLSGFDGERLISVSGMDAAGVSVDPRDGSVWVADYANHRLVKLLPGIADGYDVTTDTGSHLVVTGFRFPRSVSVNPVSGVIWVADAGNNQVVRLLPNVSHGYDIGTGLGSHTARSGFSNPYSVSVNSTDGSAWVADYNHNQVVKLSATGTTETIRVDGFRQPIHLDTSFVDGSVWIADYGNNQVVRLAADGSLICRAGGFSNPYAVAVDPLNGSAWVADYYHDQVVHLAPNGTELMRISGISRPRAVAVIADQETAGRYPVASAALDRNNVAPGETIVFSGTGQDPDGTLRRYEWDFDGDGTIDFQSGTTGITTHAYPQEGLYNPVFRVTDNDWLTATDYSQIVRVGELTAAAQADVLSGSAPLEVNFSGSFVDPIDGFVDSYQWDFDGDNIFDHFSDVTPDIRKTFDRAGQYTVVFKITDGPHTALDRLVIDVSPAPPAVTASAVPAIGKLPLTVAFSGTATDPDGDILLYEWDFDGDGVFDRASVSGPDVSHTYLQAGSYAAVLRVTDNDGTVASASVTIDAGSEQVPFTAAAHADQTGGRAPLTVNFDADQSTGDDIVTYEWHFGDCRLFSDSLDTAENWQADTPWHLTGTDFTSRPFAWTNSVNGTYPDNADHSLTSRSLDLSGVTSATLNFQHRYKTESYRDYCRVEISVDGGATWQYLANYYGNRTAWTQVSINLGGYLPSPDVRIRFRFTSNDSVTDEGWFVDDVRICSDEADWVASDDGTAAHTYAQSGTWTARLRLTDGSGAQKTDTVDIHVDPAYFPEAAADAAPVTGESPLAVTFTAQATDTDGTVVSHAWNFGEEYVWVADEVADQAVRLCQDAGCEMARTAGFDNPYAVSVNPSDGTVWVADYYHNEVVRLSASGQTELVRAGGFNRPVGVSVNPADGSVWVSDHYNNQVVKLSSDGTERIRVGGFYRPWGVSVNSADSSVWVSDYSNHQVVKLSGEGVGLKRISGFSFPMAVSVNPSDGSVWVANTTGDTVVRLDADVRDGYHIGDDTGSHLNVTGFNDPYGVSVNPADSSVWVTDFYNNQVVHLGPDGSELSRTDGFNRPIGVAVNPTDGTAWVADYYNNEVVKLAPSGRVLARRGGFNRPRSVAVAGTGAANLFSSSSSGNTTHTYAKPGLYHAVFTATDNDGYVDEQSVDISVFGSPQVTASASTVSGSAPMEVFFTAGIVELSGTVVRYEWDFDGDGAFDSLSGITPNVRHVYPVSGTFQATFRATTDLGYEGTDSVTVTVSASGPDARAAAAPVSGNLPLTVNFTGTGTDPDGSIAAYEWDFDGDGTMDFTSTATGSTQHTYSVAGSYTAMLRVTDNQGLTATDTVAIRVAEASEPSAVIQPVSGLSGYAPYNAWFHVQGIDPDGTIVKVEIDFDGDGTFDVIQPTAFGDDMETGTGSWTADGSWARTMADAWSPSFSWTDSPDGNYGDNADTALTSPTIDLTGTTAPELVFRHKYDLKGSDYGRIEISGNDGGTWSQLKAVSNAVQTEWVKESFDLSAYAGNPSVKIRFRLTSNAADTGDGWYVDDVWVGEPVGHTFTAPGTHDVVLRVTDNNGNVSETTRTVRVTAGENAAFVWVADYNNSRVVKLSDRGDVLARISGFNRPRVVEVVPETGDVWVSDTFNNRIVRLDDQVPDGYDISQMLATDRTANGSFGVLYGNTVLSDTGRLNSGYYFDGSWDYVQIPDHPDFHMDSWTLEAWIRPDILSGNRTVVGKVSQGKDLALMMTGDKISALIYDGGRKYVTSPDALTAGQWYHAAAVYDAGTGLVRLYVDGVLKAEQALTPDTSNTDPLMIGKSNCCSEFFYGTIDEVRVWNIARSQIQISGSRNAELSGTESGLVGYWPLNSIDTPYHLAIPGFNTPYGLGVDTSDNSVWVADRNNHRMVHLDSDGTVIRRIYGFSYPQDVVVSPDDAAIWVSDTYNDRVVKLLPQVTDGYAASTAGITPDSGQQGNFGMLIGDAKIDEGHLDSGMWFDGSGDYVVVGPDPSLDVQSFTVEAWVNGSYVTDRSLFMRGDDAGRNELYIGFDNSTTVQAILDNGASIYFSGEVNFTDGQWHHVAVVYDGSLLTCYADGAVYGIPVSVDVTLDFAGSQALIGADFDNFNSSVGNYFSGRIDEVRVWNTARTPAQIGAAMNSELTGTESGLAGYWRFNTRIDPWSRVIGGFNDPTGLALDPGDNGVWVTDYYNDQVVKLASDGSEQYRKSGYNRPYSVAVTHGDRTAWVGDYENDRVVKLRPDGNETAWAFGVDNPHDVAVNPDDGTVWVADHFHHQVVGLAPDGTEQVRVDGFKNPTSVAIDPAKRRLVQPPAATAGAVPSGDGNVPLEVSFTGSGTDNGTIVEYAWDFDGDGVYDYVSGTTGDTDHTYAAPGTYSPVLRITDDAGLMTYVTPGTVVAGPLTVRPAVSPESGSAPLNTTLTGYVTGLPPGRHITEYAWDFEGDGVFDYTHSSIPGTGHAYGEGGTYTAVLRVTDDLGRQALGSVRIQVTKQPPAVTNYADPVTGATPLTVYLNMSASDSDGALVLYEWDYDGDGIYDWFSTTDGRTWFTYKIAGTYQPTVRVTDSDGLTATAARTVTVSDQQHPPVAAATASVTRGGAPLAVDFTGTGIDSDGEIRLYEWDFEGDGTVDVTSTDTGDTSFTYTASGVFTPRLRVTDDDGLTGDTTLQVTVTDSGVPVPVAGAVPRTGATPLTVTFSADGSMDPDGTIVRYDWLFGSETVWVADHYNDRVKQVTGMQVEAVPVGFNDPYRLSVNPDGTVWVSDYYNDQIVKVSADGVRELVRAGGFNRPYGVSADPADGGVWVADYNNSQVVRLESDGTETVRAGGFRNPTAVSVYHHDRSVWVADYNNSQVVRLASDGSELARITGFNRPFWVEVDQADGSVWVADRYNHRVVKLVADTPTGYDTGISLMTGETTSQGHAMLFGDAAAAGTGRISGAVSLDGSGDYVLIPSDSFGDLTSVTVEAWINSTYVNGRAVFMRGDAAGGNEIYFGFYNGSTIEVVLDNGASRRFSGGINFADGTWHHVAVTYDETTQTLSCYADGAPYGTPVAVSVPDGLTFEGSHALIGSDFDNFNGSLGNFFAGRIDDVRVWNVARTPAQVSGSMNAALTGSEPGLIGYWPLDDVYPAFCHRILTGFNGPLHVAVNPGDHTAWVCDYDNSQVVRVSSDNTREILRVGGFNRPHEAAVHPVNGTVWVADRYNNQIVRLSGTGEEIQRISGFYHPTSVALAPSGFRDGVSLTSNQPVTHTYPNIGTYTASLTVTDNEGKSGTDTVTIQAGTYPEARAIAYPTSGTVPLTVRFAASGVSTDGTIEYFRWDFDGDGTTDWETRISENRDYTYTRAGIYTATLSITDNRGLTDVRQVVITVHPSEEVPEVVILPDPAGGRVPLDVHFTGLARDHDSTIVRFEWDFDGDGAFDFTSDSSATASHRYAQTGTYTVTLRVTDSDGVQGTGTVPVSVRAAGAPVAAAEASVTHGAAALDVHFTGSGAELDTIVAYEWDFDGDGTFDVSSGTSGQADYTYTIPGAYRAALRITNDKGLTDTAFVNILVTAGISASLSRESFDPAVGETIAINSVLTAPATVTVRITDRTGGVIRTLVRNAARTPGYYSDTWDGRDDQGRIMDSGAYLYVIHYETGGKSYVYDLTNGISGAIDKITPVYPATFNPFNADTNFFRYTLDRKSEITVYISPFTGGAQARVKTLLLRHAQKAGSYVLVWDGTDDAGNVVDAMSYVLAVFKWPLPDNAIIVNTRPVISDPLIKPAYLNPDARPYHDQNQAVMTYTLSKPADVTFSIYDSRNYIVRTLTIADVPAGAGNTIVWDGKNSDGRYVTPGIYRTKLVATDARGNRSMDANALLIVFY